MFFRSPHKAEAFLRSMVHEDGGAQFFRPLLFFFDHRNIIKGRFQQEIDEFVAGAVGLCGKVVQTGDGFVLHADGNDFMSILTSAGGLFCNLDFALHGNHLTIMI